MSNIQVINTREVEQQTHSVELIQYLHMKNISLSFIESSNNSVVSKLIYPSKRKRNQNGNFSSFENSNLVVKEIKHKKEGNHCEQCIDLQNEVRRLKSVSHDQIIKLHDNQIYAFPRSCAIFLPQARSDLFDYMTNYTAADNFKSIKICFQQIGQAIQYLHTQKNLIHGDVKPENVFVFTKRDFRLADFGFCKKFQVYQTRKEFLEEYLTRSLKYLPPEFTDCFENENYNMNLIDEYSSDVFGLGVALFQVIFKQCPYDQEQEFFCENIKNQGKEKTNQHCSTSSSDEISNMKLVSLAEMKQKQLLLNSTKKQEQEKKKEQEKKRKFYHREDNLYKCFYSPDRIQEFWNYFKNDIQNLMRNTNLKQSDINQLKDLIQKLITPFSFLRLSISQFLNHPWFGRFPEDE